MKRLFMYVAAIAAMMATTAFGAAADNPVLRIMPLGDSITHGSQSVRGNGYRAPLYVALTNLGKSPIGKVSDLVLSTVSDETNYSILGLNSRIAQLAIIDTLYSYLVCHLPQADTAIKETENALQSKKF